MVSPVYLQAQPYPYQSEAHNPTNTEYTGLPNEEAPKLSLLFPAVTSPSFKMKTTGFLFTWSLPMATRQYLLPCPTSASSSGMVIPEMRHASIIKKPRVTKWGKHSWFHSRNGDYRSIAVTQSWEASQLLSSPTPLPVPPCLTVPDDFMVHHPLHLWMAQRQ